MLRFGLPYAIVTALAFGVSLLGKDEPAWVVYAAGWVIALTSMGVAFLRPNLWMLAPFGALAGALLVREATDGLGAGLGPLLLIPAIAVAVYGSRRALALMVGTIALIVMSIEIFVESKPGLSQGWQQDMILVVLATVLAVAIQDLVMRMREERELAAFRGRQIENLNSVTKAIATSANGGLALCETTTDVTDAIGVGLFQMSSTGDLELVASKNGRRDILRQVASGPSLVPRKTINARKRHTLTNADDEMNLQRLAWQDVNVGTIVWEPIELDGRPLGVLALAYPPEWQGDSESVLPIDLLAAEGAIAIQQHQVTEQLELLATTDPLTNVDNRRGWEKVITHSIARARRLDQPLCLALLDLDRFKDFNDKNGHPAGDRLLEDCVQAWRDLMRADDHIARFGGDEFVVTLPNTGLSQATEVIDRLRAACPDDETCSAGVAEWIEGESVDDLVERSDAALYAAKESGRDRIIANEERTRGF
ncbi:MAG: sensor domain-containing diguanylate cyclase [Solirubrobacterales bacterium]